MFDEQQTEAGLDPGSKTQTLATHGLDFISDIIITFNFMFQTSQLTEAGLEPGLNRKVNQKALPPHRKDTGYTWSGLLFYIILYSHDNFMFRLR